MTKKQWLSTFSRIRASSLWRENNSTLVRVWIALLALCDGKGIAEGTVPGLASLCRLPVDEVTTVLVKLANPDQYTGDQEFEGRRIAAVEGGWLILNHPKYREREARERAANIPPASRWRRGLALVTRTDGPAAD